jgi:redox-sensitive bicupin YhaK (pirin superfamily)
LLIHHWKSELPGGQRPQDVGVGPHPHRGFSPVTFIYKGSIEHRDSLGNFAKVDAGGTQWMFAGRGITHSERFGKEMAEQGGELEFIQFWVNAPAKNKMDAPFYSPISKAETPMVESLGAKIWVVSGDYNGTKGAAPTNSPQLLLRGEIEKDAELEIPISSAFNTILYLLDGSLELSSSRVKAKDMVVFDNDGEGVTLKANENTRFIILSGVPLNEKVESYGPFVMNNQTEVMQAVRDAQMGKMGILIEEFD